jgi:hypothetical protein
MKQTGTDKPRRKRVRMTRTQRELARTARIGNARAEARGHAKKGK